MFNFLKKKNKKVDVQDNSGSQQVASHSHAAAPGTEIRYNPNLIGKLEDDHQALLKIFGEINAAVTAANYSLVAEKLKEFKRGFLDHILVENVSLYVYMKSSFKDDEGNIGLVQEFRSEMDEIGKAVRAFILKYETIGINKDVVTSFAEELGGIGEALVARIQREEGTLYPLYQPAYGS